MQQLSLDRQPSNKKIKMSDQSMDIEEIEVLDSKALNKFSRQNAALGAETTAKLIKMKVLIVGVRGVGIETAKNLSLQGVGAITIIDNNPVEMKDLGLNFFLTEDDVVKKKTRGIAIIHRLQELNSLCLIKNETILTDAIILQHSALIITEPKSMSELVSYNQFCRINKVSFFYALTCGISTSIFVDHGESHMIHDANGEKPIQKLITDITVLNHSSEIMNTADITIHSKSNVIKSSVEQGSVVYTTELLIRYDHPAGQLPEAIGVGHFEITDVQGFDGKLNHHTFEVSRHYSDPVKTIRVKLLSHHAPGSSTLPPYVSGGMLTEKKIPRLHLMESWDTKVKNPGSTWADPPSLVLTDLLNIGSELQQHVALCGLLKYVDMKLIQSKASKTSSSSSSSSSSINGYKLLPILYNETDAQLLLQYCHELLSTKQIIIDDFQLDEAFILRYAKLAAVELQPLAAFTGGVLAQEVVKCTGKFTPIPGFMHFSTPEVLPATTATDLSSSLSPTTTATTTTTINTTPRNHRYDELASLFGWEFVEKLGGLKYFMVGCGALGCEFVKNFALNGICCGTNGKLIITDGDRIELSNLTRQFLFREHNVGHLKSKAAGIMAKKMNVNLHVEALELYVGTNTENTFNDEFWMKLDGICNALDNMEARRYVDEMCVKYEKSLLESGTMGTSGNIDTICPFKTKTYRDGGNAVEGGQIPMCTLRNFPQITDHCIEWARDQFALLFTKLIKNTESYMKSPGSFEEEIKSLSDSAQAIFITRTVTSMIKTIAKPTILSLVQLSYDIFHFLFRDRILDLQNTFPVDKRIIDKDGKDKGPFWGEKKKYPTVAQFSLQDESHQYFLLSTTCLFGVSLGIIPPKEENDEKWCSEYKQADFLVNLLPLLTVPEYVFSTVNTTDDEDNNGGDNTNTNTGDNTSTTNQLTNKKEDILNQLLATLSQASQAVESMPTMIFTEFEKDDDQNFHIHFITSTANLRCDNYNITRTNFQSCKIIAGKIIAAIATTTAAVCGLVILELFKLVMQKPTDSYMNRQIGLAMNNFTSFTADPPNKFITSTESTIPSIETSSSDMFNEQGQIKDEFIIKTIKRVYPENHSVWDKIKCSGLLTLKEFSQWLEAEHSLKLLSWDFIIGYKSTVDEDGKKTGISGVSTPVYPPKVLLNPTLLPDLSLTFPQATQQIMKSALAKPTQEYIKLWKDLKAQYTAATAGGGGGDINAFDITTVVMNAQKDAITSDMTIQQILLKMEFLGISAQMDKSVETRSVTGLDKRVFWIIPGNESPRCLDLKSGEEIEYLASIKFEFTTGRSTSDGDVKMLTVDDLSG